MFLKSKTSEKMNSMGNMFLLKFCYISVSILFYTNISRAEDMLRYHQLINDSETLVSAGKRFQLGFFTPSNSKNRYLGVWFANIPIQTIVWVANRDAPLNDSSATLKFGDDGNLILTDQTERVAWSTNIRNLSSRTAVAQLLDSGNLVLRDATDGNVESYYWQSFDYPSDTMLAGMKIGWDLRTSFNRYLTSWKSTDDPSPGDASCGVVIRGIPQIFVSKGSVKKWRTGMYDFLLINGSRMRPNSAFSNKFIINTEEVYYEFGLYHENEPTRLVSNYSGAIQRYVWNDRSLEWVLMYAVSNEPCESYGQCGPNAICTINEPRICSCIPEYAPKSPQEWDMSVWSSGCNRKTPLNCSKGEGFIKFKGLKIPDTLHVSMNTNMTLDECKNECLKNCSCTAYANSDSTGMGSGCLIWYGNLVDIRRSTNYNDQHLYIRVTASDLGPRDKRKLMLGMIAVSVFLVMLLIASFILWRWRLQRGGTQTFSQPRDEENLELPIFSIISITEATNNFSDSNKIGEGGFGPVYKGQLSTGQDIAVKKLSKSSSQGLQEFKNEVILIAKLQHRNLVRLLGCCIHGEERMLIYEYMPNGSLDSLIFDKNISNSLVWRTRFNIILGIARGLLYLHRDSRLRIIHRDLKASNVLLDQEMHPKISDFGIARAVGGDQLMGKTKTVVGTYGYMSPEYVIRGLFSIKSDVFSFGVMALEIMSGIRNIQFRHPDQDLTLLGHAWNLWMEGNAYKLVEELSENTSTIPEILRCIQVGLLCVQQCPEDRPTISSVLSMLDSDSSMLPQPKQPGFYAASSPSDLQLLPQIIKNTTNKLTTTLLEGR